VIVDASRAGSYEERTCLRCFEGRVYDIRRGAWVVCERCSGTTRVVVTSTQAKAPSTVEWRVIHFVAPAPLAGLRFWEQERGRSRHLRLHPF
jgi:hypothetical protein